MSRSTPEFVRYQVILLLILARLPLYSDNRQILRFGLRRKLSVFAFEWEPLLTFTIQYTSSGLATNLKNSNLVCAQATLPALALTASDFVSRLHQATTSTNFMSSSDHDVRFLKQPRFQYQHYFTNRRCNTCRIIILIYFH